MEMNEKENIIYCSSLTLSYQGGKIEGVRTIADLLLVINTC